MQMNSRQMRQAMKKMGIAQENLEAEEVIIKLSDRDIVISNPEVAKVNMMGQETFQITGEISELARDTTPDIEPEDIATVVEQTNVTKEEAALAIKNANGDLAEAILSFQEDEE